MKVLHVHFDGGADASSGITIDPEVAKQLDEYIPRPTMEGIEARWDAVALGHCQCGEAVLVLARKERRRMKTDYSHFIRHGESCPAMVASTRSWHWMHHKMGKR